MTNPFPERLLQRNTAVEGAPLQQETILFHPKSNRFCILNRTASFIWNKLEFPTSPEHIAQDLSANYSGVTRADAMRDVQQAVATLLELDLVVPLTEAAGVKG